VAGGARACHGGIRRASVTGSGAPAFRPEATDESGVRSIAPPSAERTGQLLEALHSVAHLVAREPDSDTLFRELAPVLATAMRASVAAVAPLVENTIGELVLAGDIPVALQPIVARSLAFVGQRRQRTIVSDDSDLLPGTATALRDTGWRDVVLVPVLHHAGHATAALLVANRVDGAAFEPTDVRLLETIAEQVVVGIDRAQLFGRLDEWSRTLEALLTFSASVHRHAEPEPLVNDVLEHAARFLKADGGRAGIVHTDAHGVVTLLSTGYWQSGAWYREPRRWTHDEGVAGRVFMHEFPYLTSDYPTDPLGDPSLQARGGVQHALAIPIKDTSHAVIGFLELHRGSDHPPFTWHDAGFLESLADMTAMAIENSRLMTELALKNYEIRQLFARHAERLEEERQHIARELHDEAGQALVGVKLSLQALSRAIPDGLPTVKTPLDELRLQVNQATARLRQLARRLRPPALDQHGLTVALSQLTHELEERSGMTIALDTEWLPERRSPVLETALFRITQEALTNVAAHARASEVCVRIGECERAMWLLVTDNGCGFDTQQQSHGLGLRGIAERVHVLGGDLHLESTSERGTRLRVRLPIG
jgi:signal transduction histidine kinase